MLILKFYSDGTKPLLGSDGTVLARDLKTVRGIERRAMNQIPSRAMSYAVFTCVNDRFYDDKSWKPVQSHVPVHYLYQLRRFYGG